MTLLLSMRNSYSQIFKAFISHVYFYLKNIGSPLIVIRNFLTIKYWIFIVLISYILEALQLLNIESSLDVNYFKAFNCEILEACQMLEALELSDMGSFFIIKYLKYFLSQNLTVK